MRIIGGAFGGRKIRPPLSDNTRPTTDRTRESLFNILASRMDFEGLQVLDLFAGTGALGLEALSRGADFVWFVEKDRKAAKIIRENIELLAVSERSKLVTADATKNLNGINEGVIDLVFADPPYGKKLGEQAAKILVENKTLRPGALLVLEESTQSMPQQLAGFETLDLRKFGDSSIGLFRFGQQTEE